MNHKYIMTEASGSSSFQSITKLFFFQGGVTEEQMLKFMGANTSLSPLQAKQLIEVFVVTLVSLHCPLFLFYILYI